VVGTILDETVLLLRALRDGIDLIELEESLLFNEDRGKIPPPTPPPTPFNPEIVFPLLRLPKLVIES